MGSSKKSTIGYRYNAPAHFVLGTGYADKIVKVEYGDKTAWTAEDDADGATVVNTSFTIDAEDLLGGDESQGGISGTFEFWNGLPTQARNDYLVGKLGSYCPAFRGVNTLIARNAYWGMSNYVSSIAVTLQRIHLTDEGATQWYDEKAEVPVQDLESAQYDAYSQIEDAPNKWYATVDDGSDDVEIGAGIISSVLHVFGAGQPYGQKGYVYTTFQFTDLADYVDMQIDCQFDDGGGIDSFDGEIVGSESLTVETGFATATRYTIRFPAATGTVDYSLSIYCTDQIPGGSDARHAIKISASFATSDIAGNMNPAHVIRELWVSKEGGKGRDESTIDDDAFTAAADQFYAEGIGVSGKWSGESTVEDFIQTMCETLDCRVYEHPYTGLLTIKLIRDDYDVDDLTVLGPKQIKTVSEFKRPEPIDLPNACCVTYYSMYDSSTATVTSIDPAAVAKAGTVNTLNKDYSDIIAAASIAARFAQRDRIAASAPIITCKLTCSRAAKDLMPGDPFVLNWPDLSDDELVMRVVTTTRGGILNQTVVLECIEDVFSLDDAADLAATVATSSYINPVSKTLASPVPIVVEAPYYELLQRLGVTQADTLLADTPDAGMLLASAVKGANILNCIAATDGSTWADYVDTCPTGTLNAAAAYLDDTLDITWDETPTTGTHIQIGDEIMRFDGLDSDGLSVVGRGCLDTVPALHAASATAWAWDAYAVSDEVERASGDTLTVTLQSRNDSKTGATVSTDITMTGRAARPYPAANVKINGESYPSVVNLDAGFIVAWDGRNRLSQADTLIATDEGSIDEEDGTTYSVELYSATGELVNSVEGSEVAGRSCEFTGAEVSYIDELEAYVPFLSHCDSLTPTIGPTLTATATAGVSTDQAKFGGSSYYIGSTTGQLSATASSVFAIGTADFCFECWIYLTATPTDAYEAIVDTRTASSSNGVLFSVNASRKLQLYGTTSVLLVSSVVVPLNTWVHACVERVSGVTTIYHNGTATASWTGGYTYSGTNFKIGRVYDLAHPALIGAYIDEIRFTNGAYRHNGNFTPLSHSYDEYAGPLDLGGAGRLIITTHRDGLECSQSYDYSFETTGGGSSSSSGT